MGVEGYRLGISLASHTLQSQEKEGLVTIRTSTRTGTRKPGASNQIRDLNLLLSNALLAAHAHILSPALLVVIRDVLL